MEHTAREQADTYQPSAGALHGVSGVGLLVVAGWLLANSIEDPFVFGSLGTAFAASGLYCVVAGAVARGVQLAGRR